MRNGLTVKAIIIIDMTDNCIKCTFIHRDYCSSVESYFCGVNHKRLSFLMLAVDL